jgi:hypothetical protein
MKYKIIHLSMLFLLLASMVTAQDNESKMSDSQKAQAVKADVYIISSKKKITDSLATARRDTTIADIKKTKRNRCRKHNKKAPETEAF